MDQAERLIEANDLARDYASLRAVDGVDIAVARGEILGLLGPNGAGKTSTLRMLCGTLAPTRGRVRIAGIDLIEQPRQAKRALGYLPEQPPLYPDMTVAEFLHYAASLHGLRAAARRRGVTTAIERCGLGEVRQRLIGHLSKGYRQRVGIAQAIQHDPAAIVLDEPTVGLDPIQIRDIRGLIAELAADHAVILSTHILPEVQAVCSRVNILHRGRIAWQESMAACSDTGRVERVTIRIGNEEQWSTDLADIELAGLREAVALGNGRFRLHLDPAVTDPAAIARTLVTAGAALHELKPEQRSLEQVFVEVTSGDAPAPAPEGRAAA